MKGRKNRATGGVAPKDPAPKEVYAGEGSNVVKEALKRKHGGKVDGKDMGKVEGGKARLRLDRPGRKMGGRVGADSSPLSSAANTDGPDKLEQMKC